MDTWAHRLFGLSNSSMDERRWRGANSFWALSGFYHGVGNTEPGQVADGPDQPDREDQQLVHQIVERVHFELERALPVETR